MVGTTDPNHQDLLLWLDPPSGVLGRIGRVGDQERNKSSYTKFDINPRERRQMLSKTPGGIARTAPNAKRSRQLLLAKKHGLRSDRNYYMPSNLAEAMIRLLDDSSNQGLHLLNPTLRNSEHVLGRVWTEQLSPDDEKDLQAVHQVLPGLWRSTPKQAGTTPNKSVCHASRRHYH